MTRPGEDRTDGERDTEDQGSKEARLEEGQEAEDEGRVQDTAQGLCTCCSPLPGGCSERYLQPTLAKAGPS